MQSNKYELRRRLMGITVRELDMVIVDDERTFRLMIKSDDDCMRLILLSDDYEIIESKCLNYVRLGTVISFLKRTLQY
ncbi:hypothetical protein [Vulcanisaeta distributa]|uniref:hypothetical protein n=1 Tax=Vulcanisaeta distributa TaxID=164451 RepID=UPI0006CF260F|nr:hypothetical protein [Vulcanisaeta distributa]